MFRGVYIVLIGGYRVFRGGYSLVAIDEAGSAVPEFTSLINRTISMAC